MYCARFYANLSGNVGRNCAVITTRGCSRIDMGIVEHSGTQHIRREGWQWTLAAGVGGRQAMTTRCQPDTSAQLVCLSRRLRRTMKGQFQMQSISCAHCGSQRPRIRAATGKTSAGLGRLAIAVTGAGRPPIETVGCRAIDRQTGLAGRTVAVTDVDGPKISVTTERLAFAVRKRPQPRHGARASIVFSTASLWPAHG
jgi:hypothetical protein